MTLRSVEIALADVLVNITPLAVERVPLAQVSSRVLAEDISADSDLPAAPNSSMDGFAVRAEDVVGASAESPVSLPVVIHIAAGSVAGRMLGHREAARIMTGAPLPPGADAIVPVEATDADWSVEAAIGETVQIHQASAAGAYVRPRGEDMRAGEVVPDLRTPSARSRNRGARCFRRSRATGLSAAACGHFEQWRRIAQRRPAPRSRPHP